MSKGLIPVIHSIVSGDALIETVLNNYAISTSQSCQIYKRGLNDTYVVKTEEARYILRVYLERRNKYQKSWGGTSPK